MFIMDMFFTILYFCLYSSFGRWLSSFTFDLVQEFPGLIISAFTIDKFGRKGSMATMFFLCCIFLLPLVFRQPQGVTTGLLFMARICITTTFTVVYIYAPEVAPLSTNLLKHLYIMHDDCRGGKMGGLTPKHFSSILSFKHLMH